MASNKIIRIGPITMGTAVANVVTAPTLTGGTNLQGTNTATYLVLRHIRVVNKTASAATFSMWVDQTTGGSTAGKEFMGTAQSVPANSYVDWYGQVRLDTADYLTGSASAATTLVFQAEGEIGIV
jgi:hypothetical protein